MLSDPAVLVLMYFVLPLWLLAGFADWFCHRASHAATTTGAKESLIHLLMFAEAGAPLIAALFLEVNALILAFLIVAFTAHEAIAIWDVSYATSGRVITPIEQHVHGFLEAIPLMALVSMVALQWGQFLALFGRGPETARFDLALKPRAAPHRLYRDDPLSHPAFRTSPLSGRVRPGMARERRPTRAAQGQEELARHEVAAARGPSFSRATGRLWGRLKGAV
jgi:hypothetical protein